MFLITFLVIQGVLGLLGFFLNPIGIAVKLARLGFVALVIIGVALAFMHHPVMIIK